jgi:hypothetical protein
LAEEQKFINFEHLEEEISKIERRRDNGITRRGQCSETVNFQAPLKALSRPRKKKKEEEKKNFSHILIWVRSEVSRLPFFLLPTRLAAKSAGRKRREKRKVRNV